MTPQKPPKRAPQNRLGIYLRISQDRAGEGETVDRHGKECRAVAKRIGGTIVDIYIDNDTSASSGKPRPQYDRMIADIIAGRINVVVAWHNDRLHRRPDELEPYIDVCQPRAVPTHFAQAGPLDLTTASGRLMARQHGIMARYETEHFIERLKSKQADAAADGLWMGGTRPFGWGVPTGAVRKNGRPIYNMYEVVPDEAAEVKRLTRAVLDGQSLGSLVADLKERGIQTTGSHPRLPDGSRALGHPDWSYATLRQVLTRKRNIGILEYHGETFTGKWPAIVDEDEFHAVCAILADPSRRTTDISNARKWLGSGIYRCGAEGCGERLRSAWAPERRGGNRRIYRCRHGKGHVYRNAEPIDALIGGGVINGEHVDGAVVEYVRRPDMVKRLQPKPAPGVDGRALRAERAALRERLLEADDMFGSLQWDRARHARQTKKINERLDEIGVMLEPRQTASVLHSLANTPDPVTYWNTLNLEGKRRTVELIMTVTVHRMGRGFHSRTFNRETVTISFKG